MDKGFQLLWYICMGKVQVYKLFKHELLIVLHDRFGRAINIKPSIS
jgi:hypothetical protein